MSLDDTTGAPQDSPPAQDVNVDSSTTQEEARVPLSRLNRVLEQNRSKDERIASIQRENDLLKSQQAQSPPTPDVTLESLDYDQEAFDNHQLDQRFEKFREKITAENNAQREKEQQETLYNSKLTNYNQLHADYVSKSESYSKAEADMNAQSMNFSPLVADVILRTNNPAVQHALMSDLTTLHKLNQLSDPTDIALAVGRIETNLQKPVSNAPDPSPSVGDGSSPGATSYEDASMDEFFAMRRSGK